MTPASNFPLETRHCLLRHRFTRISPSDERRATNCGLGTWINADLHGFSIVNHPSSIINVEGPGFIPPAPIPRGIYRLGRTENVPEPFSIFSAALPISMFPFRLDSGRIPTMRNGR